MNASNDGGDEALRGIKMCTVRPVPENKVIDAAIKAIKENPRNAPMNRPRAGGGVAPTGAMEMAVLTEKKWKPGRTIRVKFLDGDPGVQAKVKLYAKQWEPHANLTLDFVDAGDAEVRISFRHVGSWSYLGTVALVIDDDEATMNFGWLTPNSSDTEYERVVVHEFGHALACIHEHQHPQAGIPWDEDKVIEYYRLTNDWDEAKTRHNVLRKYSSSITQFSDYDSDSIMQYSVPNELTIGDFSVGWNTKMSKTDKEFVGRMYPGRTTTITLEPGTPVNADIGKHGEEDEYQFTVAGPAPAAHTISTEGPTDVVMALYGPGDPALLRADDDDSGTALNARIEETLAPGAYTVRVRHYWPRGKGRYTITLE